MEDSIARKPLIGGAFCSHCPGFEDDHWRLLCNFFQEHTAAHSPSLGKSGKYARDVKHLCRARSSGISKSTAATTTGFRSVKPRTPTLAHNMLGALIISVVSVAHTENSRQF